MDNILQGSVAPLHLQRVTNGRKKSVPSACLVQDGQWEGTRRGLWVPFFSLLQLLPTPSPAAVLAKQEKGKEMPFLQRGDKRLFASEGGSVLNKWKLSVLFICLFGAFFFFWLLLSHPINHWTSPYHSLNCRSLLLLHKDRGMGQGKHL